MQLTRVTLKNYGVYRGSVEFDLTTKPGRPIVLVGGTNGAGKTTLFESVLVGFYGPASLGRRHRRSEYDEFLASRIHRYVGTTSSAGSASVTIEFKFYHNGAVDDYAVDRAWANDDGRIVEELRIKRNGRRLDAVDEGQWQSFIDELIPPGIARLFFFDGEKIVRMAEGGDDDAGVRSSFDSLLGMDVVSQLHSDLSTYVMRNMKGSSKAILAEHKRHLAEREGTEDEIARLEDRLGECNARLDRTGSEIDVAEAQISRMGGGFAARRGDLARAKSELEAKMRSLEESLREAVSGPLPFCLVPEQIRSVRGRILADREITRRRYGREVLDAKLAEVSGYLESDEFLADSGAGPGGAARAAGRISEIFGAGKGDGGSEVFDFAESESAGILSLIDGMGMGYPEGVRRASEEYDGLADELGRVDAALLNAPADDEVGKLVSGLKSLHEERGMARAEAEHLGEQLAAKRSYVKLLNSKLRSIVADRHREQDAGRQEALAVRAQRVLDRYAGKLKARKLEVFESHLLDAARMLMHKDNLVTSVTVDGETMEITLHGGDGRPLPKGMLSKGEKQMYATAVLLALARTSGRPLPFMIDTPLARLDVAHRDNLVERFFPHASHQVVIFSTDSEIDGRYYAELKPHVSRSYSMEYVAGEGRTVQHAGYFGDPATGGRG